MAGETILIVEDRHESIVYLANSVLRPAGYEVITAMDGYQGLESILADRPDLVIMDLNLPRMDGLEVLAALQERGVGIPVILTTFYGSEKVAERASRLGAAACVVKPYETSQMLNAVRRALRNRPLPRPQADEQPETLIPFSGHLERWMRDMKILTRVGKALVAQLDTEHVCVRTVESAIYFSRADHAFLFLAKEDDDALSLCAMRGAAEGQVRLIQQRVESDLVRKVARSGKSKLQPKMVGEEALVAIAGDPLGPAVAVPLRWQGQVVGVLLVARLPGEAGLSESDAEWLTGLADYAAIAIHNARAYEERTAQAPGPQSDKEILSEVHHDLEQLGEMLQAAAETVQRLAARLAGGKSD
jgi:two-component system NtrC family sensor kinase